MPMKDLLNGILMISRRPTYRLIFTSRPGISPTTPNKLPFPFDVFGCWIRVFTSIAAEPSLARRMGTTRSHLGDMAKEFGDMATESGRRPS